MTFPKDTNIDMEIHNRHKYDTMMEDPNEEDGISPNASMVDQVEGPPTSPHDWNIEMEMSGDQKYDIAKGGYDEEDGMSSNESMVDQFKDSDDSGDGFASRPLSNTQLVSNFNEAEEEDTEMDIRTRYFRSNTPSPENIEDMSHPAGRSVAAISPSMTERSVTVVYESFCHQESR
jgi:hypothetical protein